jgi:hypothetical protein
LVFFFAEFLCYLSILFVHLTRKKNELLTAGAGKNRTRSLHPAVQRDGRENATGAVLVFIDIQPTAAVRKWNDYRLLLPAKGKGVARRVCIGICREACSHLALSDKPLTINGKQIRRKTITCSNLLSDTFDGRITHTTIRMIK